MRQQPSRMWQQSRLCGLYSFSAHVENYMCASQKSSGYHSCSLETYNGWSIQAVQVATQVAVRVAKRVAKRVAAATTPHQHHIGYDMVWTSDEAQRHAAELRGAQQQHPSRGPTSSYAIRCDKKRVVLIVMFMMGMPRQ